MRFKRISAAARPISRNGWRTVVKPGLEGGTLNVVKSDDGNIFAHPHAGLA